MNSNNWPSITIEEIQRLMIENGIGRIPVGGEVVGIVTRKDILRFLHGRDYLKYPGSKGAWTIFTFRDQEECTAFS